MPRAVKAPENRAEWLQECPLRKWFNRKPRGEMVRLAAATGLSKKIFCYWMLGKVMPRASSMTLVRHETGITLEQWVRWLGREPAEVNDDG